MKRVLATTAIVITLFCFSNTALSGETAKQELTGSKVSFGLGANLGYLSGDTRYHIIFPAYVEGLTVGESELQFPLDSWIGGLNASIGKKGVWAINLSLSKNITGDTGNMKDSDWVTYSPTQEKVKFSYAEADTDMDAFLADINGRYYFLRGEQASLGLIGGYKYQDLSFDISNAFQESPVGWFPSEFLPGKVLTYEITYKIPYGGLTFDLRPSEKFSLNLLGTYGKAFAEDEDNHILRFKRFNATSKGPYYSFKAEGNLSLSKRLSLQMALEYLKIDVDGVQTQTWYATTKEAPAGTTIGNIDYWAKSEQTYIYAGIRYAF